MDKWEALNLNQWKEPKKIIIIIERGWEMRSINSHRHVILTKKDEKEKKEAK